MAVAATVAVEREREGVIKGFSEEGEKKVRKGATPSLLRKGREATARERREGKDGESKRGGVEEGRGEGRGIESRRL